MVKTLAAELAGSVGQSLSRVSERLSAGKAGSPTTCCGRSALEKALHDRTPQEVVLRYQRNGHVN